MKYAKYIVVSIDDIVTNIEFFEYESDAIEYFRKFVEYDLKILGYTWEQFLKDEIPIESHYEFGYTFGWNGQYKYMTDNNLSSIQLINLEELEKELK